MFVILWFSILFLLIWPHESLQFQILGGSDDEILKKDLKIRKIRANLGSLLQKRAFPPKYTERKKFHLVQPSQYDFPDYHTYM